MAGPDEWLLVAPEADGAALAADLARALAGAAHSLVDVSHRQVALEIAGPRAADLLASHCMLDLDDAAFPAGMCARTLFATAEIVLWRRAADRFHVEAWRSFAPYVEGMLREAAVDLD